MSIDYKQVAREVMDELRVPGFLRSADGTYLRCEHAQTQLRRRKIANGSVTIYLQCLDCGGSVGSSHKKTYANVSSPPWDEALEKKTATMREQFSAFYQARLKKTQDNEQAAWEDLYRRHVNPNNPAWMELRRRVLVRCKSVCEGCGLRTVEHVHHLTYAHLGDELLFELVGVCRPCHRKLHPAREL